MRFVWYDYFLLLTASPLYFLFLFRVVCQVGLDVIAEFCLDLAVSYLLS